MTMQDVRAKIREAALKVVEKHIDDLICKLAQRKITSLDIATFKFDVTLSFDDKLCDEINKEGL